MISFASWKMEDVEDVFSKSIAIFAGDKLIK